ncbi:uncharacterized protein A4U43_C02F16140 [Asparagus officinalis]|uniref:Uncharacterized protein n=1 Tax=Asparagus officinalis TaxID=4686 RepID=A0A5P1FKJ3_ASPOF|nr:uncharacterized protein A4U43_C02F16140 [Asparagus officinalis]
MPPIMCYICPLGLRSVTALGVGTPNLGCKYVKAIPHGSGGHIDADCLDLLVICPEALEGSNSQKPKRSDNFIYRYMTENFMQYRAPRNTDHPELRQPLALEVW